MTELCLPLTLVLACLAVVAAVVAPNLLVARRKRVALWRSLGRELGMEFSPLRLDGVMQLTGQVGRRKVSVYETGSDRQVVHIVPIISLPRRLELSARRSVVRGGGQAMKHPSELTLDRTANEDVKTYLANERVWKTMSTFLAEGGAVQSGTLVLEGVGTTAAQVSALIGRAVEVARALERERVAPWEKLGALDGLNMTVDGNWYDVQGTVGEVGVALGGDPSRGTCEIVAHAPAGLPPELRITRGASQLDDPILDRMVEVSLSPSQSITSLLTQPAIREDLVAVIHRHPGSSLTAERLTVRVASFSDPRLPEYVGDAAKLIRSLAEGLQGGDYTVDRHRGRGHRARGRS